MTVYGSRLLAVDCCNAGSFAVKNSETYYVSSEFECEMGGEWRIHWKSTRGCERSDRDSTHVRHRCRNNSFSLFPFLSRVGNWMIVRGWIPYSSQAGGLVFVSESMKHWMKNCAWVYQVKMFLDNRCMKHSSMWGLLSKKGLSRIVI